jgi:hypothetical protein
MNALCFQTRPDPHRVHCGVIGEHRDHDLGVGRLRCARCELRPAAEALGRGSRAVVHGERMPGVDEPRRHFAAHAPEPDYPDVHSSRILTEGG